jgi:hypothetical protein
MRREDNSVVGWLLQGNEVWSPDGQRQYGWFEDGYVWTKDGHACAFVRTLFDPHSGPTPASFVQDEEPQPPPGGLEPPPPVNVIGRISKPITRRSWAEGGFAALYLG